MSEKLRRISAILIALALGVGLLAHGVGASNMGVKMALAAANDMPATDKCDGCGSGDDGMSLGACSAYCSTFTALPSAAAVFDMLPMEIRGHTAVPIAMGWGIPPDPYPPKPTILS